MKIADNLKDLAFEYATSSGISVGMSDFFKITGYQELQQAGIEKVAQINQMHRQGFVTERERYNLVIRNWF